MLPEFLQDLLNGQQVRVGEPRPISEGEMQEAGVIVSAFEQNYRISLPGNPPRFDAEAAAWSAAAVYSAACLVVYRDAGQPVLDELLGAKPPDGGTAAAHYSVDLVMRFLPDLVKLAKSAATDDPLIKRLLAWAVAWPLSSVGMEGVGSVDSGPLRTSPTLMRLYADRVIATGDRSRLDDPALAEQVKVAIGNYPELCPRLELKINPPAR